MTRHVREWKEKEFQTIKSLVSEYPVIGVADLSLFPASLFQSLRKKLHGKAVVKVSKTRVIKKALQETALKNSKLVDNVKGSCGLIFTKMNPFELYSFIKKNKGASAAKPGMIAPEDILVTSQDTGIPPGPALTDLKNAGLKVRPGGASIVITEDAVVTKKGQTVTPAVASALLKLNIKPIKIGLNLTVAFEENQLFSKNVLDIDEEQVFNNFKTAYSNAFNLATSIVFISKETLPLLIAKAFNESRNLAFEAKILTKETTGLLLAKASAQALALQSLVKNE